MPNVFDEVEAEAAAPAPNVFDQVEAEAAQSAAPASSGNVFDQVEAEARAGATPAAAGGNVFGELEAEAQTQPGFYRTGSLEDVAATPEEVGKGLGQGGAWLHKQAAGLLEEVTHGIQAIPRNVVENLRTSWLAGRWNDVNDWLSQRSRARYPEYWAAIDREKQAKADQASANKQLAVESNAVTTGIRKTQLAAEDYANKMTDLAQGPELRLNPKGAISKIGGIVGQAIPVVSAMALTRNPQIGAGLYATLTQGGAYHDAKASGQDDTSALGASLLQAAAAYAGGRVNMENVFLKPEAVRSAVTKYGGNRVAGWALQYAKATGSNVGAMEAQQLFDNAVAQGYDGNRKTFDGLAEQAMLGLMFSLIHARGSAKRAGEIDAPAGAESHVLPAPKPAAAPEGEATPTPGATKLTMQPGGLVVPREEAGPMVKPIESKPGLTGEQEAASILERARTNRQALEGFAQGLEKTASSEAETGRVPIRDAQGAIVDWTVAEKYTGEEAGYNQARVKTLRSALKALDAGTDLSPKQQAELQASLSRSLRNVPESPAEELQVAKLGSEAPMQEAEIPDGSLVYRKGEWQERRGNQLADGVKEPIEDFGPVDGVKIVVPPDHPLFQEARKEFAAQEAGETALAAETPLSLKQLPEYAQHAINSEAAMLRTNRGVEPAYADSQWERVTLPLSKIEATPTTFLPRGSVTKGPIVIDASGKVLDGNNRLYEARKRGDSTIEVFRQVAAEGAAELADPGQGVLGAPRQAAVRPTPVPPPAPGMTMVNDARMGVTMERTAPGQVNVQTVMKSLEAISEAAGGKTPIRTGNFKQRARGIYKVFPEVARLEQADNIPTAIHEIAHDLQKQAYGTVKGGPFQTFVPELVNRELVGLGKALYGNTKPAGGYKSEGFAEFVRYYLSTEDAKRVAPSTLKWFTNDFLKARPAVAEAMAAARGTVDTWRRQGALERAQQQIVPQPGAMARVGKALKDFFSYEGQLESLAGLQELSTAAAKRTGRTLRPQDDPFLVASMRRGTAGAIVKHWTDKAVTDLWGNPVGPSLRQALAPVKGNRKEFSLYLWAQQALDLWKQGKNPGITKEDAAYIEQLYRSPEFELAADQFRTWNDAVLSYVVEANPAMADVVAKMREANPRYVPLARAIEPSQAKAFAARAASNPMMRRFGSGLPIRDIFETTLQNAEKMIGRAHRDQVLQAVAKLSKTKGLGFLVEEVPVDQIKQQVNLDQVRRQLAAEGVDLEGVPDDLVLTYYRQADAPKGSAPITAIQGPDGKTRWYQVDPRVYDILEGMDVPKLGPVLDLVLGAPARAFRTGTTGLRASFSLVTNPLRDVRSWVLQSQSHQNPARLLGSYFGGLRSAIVEGLGGKGGPEGELFRALGANLGNYLGQDIRYTRQAAKGLFHGRTMRVVASPIEHLRELLSISEAAPRIAEIKALARDVGWTPGTPITADQAVQLALAAKRATTDFSAAGTYSRVINQAVPFFNANIQGTRAFARALKQNPARAVLLGLTTLTLPALANWWVNKDEDWYKHMPWRERYLYDNIDDGKNVWQIPRPFEWGNLFSVIPEALVDAWYRKDPESAKAALKHVFETQNPAGLPVALQVAKDQWANQVAFWDRPIVPRSEIDLPPGAQVGPYTSRLARWLGEAFPNTVSPRRIDAAVRGFFGGLAPDIMDAAGLGSKVDREAELSDFPVIGRIWRRGGQYTAGDRYVSEFYDALSQRRAMLQESRRADKAGHKSLYGDLSATEEWVRGGERLAQEISEAMKIASRSRSTAGRQALYRVTGRDAEQYLKQLPKLPR